MKTKEKVRQKQVESSIDYRKQYITNILAQIQDLLKELNKINVMPEELVREKVLRERYAWMEIGEKNRELSNTLKKMEDY